MYERILSNQEVPTFDNLIQHSGKNGKLWLDLDEYLTNEFQAVKLIRFGFGNEGWSVKYSKKNKYICDVFAENGAFLVFFRVSNNAIGTIYDELDENSKQGWQNKYPCGEGGWIRIRVLNDEHLKSLKKIINAKMTVRT